MGRKKRPTTLTKPSPSSPDASTAASLAVRSPVPVPQSDDPSTSTSPQSIKQDCERALIALRRGNHTKSLRLLRDSIAKHPTAALLQRVHATVSVKLAALIDDPAAKSKHLRTAIDAAKRSTELSPNSVEFSHFYANLLYEAASEQKEYEEVMAECERGLNIKDPVDPAKEGLSEESGSGNAGVEERIGAVQGEIKGLIQKANLASISTWMKHLSSGEERFRLIPIRRAAEDPMEARMAGQVVRRPNEIKKATKTVEERRKEIEVRVQAAKLMQQNSERIGGEGGEGTSSSPVNGGSGGGGGSSRRRQWGLAAARRNGAERKDQVRKYWDSIGWEVKRGFLRVRVCDLRNHHRDGVASEVLREALSWGEKWKDWRFWACCRCGEKFGDAESHLHHVGQEHMGSLVPKMQSVVPQNVEGEWAEMIVSCSWKPLDLNASVTMLENQGKAKDSVCDEEENGKDERSWSEGFGLDAGWESFPVKKKSLVDRSEGGSLEVAVKEEDKMECDECDGNEGGSKVYNLPNSWPLSDDTECAKLLEKISSILSLLLKHKYLATSHLQKVIQFTVDELRGLVPGSQLLSCGIDQTPLCICFLGASQLRKIVKFLQEICHACGISRYPEKNSSDDAISHQPRVVTESEEKIELNEDASCLLLDDNLVSGDADSENVSSPQSAKGVQSGSYPPLLSWLYDGPLLTEQLTRWSRVREEKSQEGIEILQVLEKEFTHLQGLCERKCENLGYEAALQGLEELCLEESNKSEHVNEFSRGRYHSALKRRRDQIVDSENEVMFDGCSRFEVEAIDIILKEAESLNLNHLACEEPYAAMGSHLADLEAGEHDWKSKDYLNQVDTCIEVAIQRQKEQLSVEISRLDARILRNLASMHQLELKLDPVSALDYRSILLPLVESFMRAHLEDLAEKDATEKSDAASKMLLAELARNEKKGSGGGSENTRSLQEKMKDKKKNRDSKRSKDTKASGQTGQLEAVNSSEGEPEDTEVLDPDMSSDLNELEEEFRRKVELEEEERKLEETLEYQRRIEHEAKQRHLAEQHKRNGQATSDDVPDHWTDVSVQPQSPSDVPLVFGNGFATGIEGLDALAINDSALIGGQQLRGDQDQLSGAKQARLPNGVHTDGMLPFDQRNGRRGRRRSSGRPQEEKYLGAPSGKENLVGILPGNVGQSDLLRNPDGVAGDSGGTKTLRQLRAEDDDDERFQADMEQAVQQSLDMYEARRKNHFVPVSRTGRRTPEALDDSVATSTEEITKISNGLDVYGTGLQNDVGEYNCFLNVIIQSLWHLRRFREEFLRRSTSEHSHVGDPCVVCALYDILFALSMAAADSKREAVAPSSLRIALSQLYPESNFFQEGQMNDASEVLAVIFQCLHKSFTPATGISDTESVESNSLGSWDCDNSACIAHSLFGMDIFERMNCYNCGLESRHMKYTSFFHNINASALRTTKEMCVESSFDELLNLVEMNHQLACDPEVSGCGKLNHIHHILSTPPHVFTAVLGWQNTCESIEDITATLAALSTEIDISALYRGLDPKNIHRLVSVVCYYGQHYHCFAYSHEHERWIMYDDKTVKVIGTWEDVLVICEKGHLQPQVLFFEAVN
ncbi:hypothetical protein Droror1_Dr00021180 [Drosera rotundifolia]